MAATTSSSRPMPLLRRPLPPKQPLLPTRSISPSPITHYEDDDLNPPSKSPILRSRAKPFSPLRGRQYHGDVPLPDTSVVQPYKPRGPPSLPARPPRKIREFPTEALIKDLYERPPPKFTLKNFMQRLPSRAGEDTFETMVSEQNYEKLTSWVAANRPKQAHIHNLDIESSIDMPDVTPRKPPMQLSIEMRVPDLGMEILESPEHDINMYTKRVTKGLPVTPATSKQTLPSRQVQRPLPPIASTLEEEESIDNGRVSGEPATTKTVAQASITELVAPEGPRTHGQAKREEERRQSAKAESSAVEEKQEGEAAVESADKQREDSREKKQLMIKEKALTFEDWPQVISYPEADIILPSSAPAYFQGEAIPRTASPFVSADEYDDQVTPLEAVILNTIVTESAVLNVKAHFLAKLPSLTQLADSLTHLNASFNDFWVFPPEILELKLLVSLKLRNNPIKALPHDINNLSQLKVLEISFNLLTTLPTSLFDLKDLELLDLSYNRLSFIPSEISNLRCLRELNLEGNQLGAMPVSTLHLQLKYFRIGNNYIHPYFWKDTASNQPQRLLDVCALAVSKTDQDVAAMVALPDTLKTLLKKPIKCDCCGGAKFGQGLRVIKSLDEVFGVKNLPFLFSACSQKCRRKFVKNKDALQLWLFRNDVVIIKED